MTIMDVEGIGPVYAEQLREAGVVTADDLLERAGTAAGRTALEQATGISTGRNLEWTNHVDLMRIKGVGSEYSDLLEAAGVDTVPELARRNPANLAITLAEAAAARNFVRRGPGEKEVTGWIEQAKELGRAIEY